ncbi:DMT family transporter [Streptomyces libani]|uniref:DMT family transporter n=2 Tax=Streptomyces nigrescens TaxID=1920 RepID=A0ABY7JCT4_STRNI|nr:MULTISPECIES: DMT family transporter [Streptomyces]MCX5445495.1 DMT family transporter [Streptomyces libani]WAU00967.1 DMT family transporter [Streptomyces libani subsp. libani]WAU08829.1 DMT family transporter [Streptomyces nigrescens]WDT53176.1 DMT family transporter [Streptomyces sp. G7(2002)]
MDVVDATSTPPVTTADDNERTPRHGTAAPVVLVISGAACLSASAMFVKLADVTAGTAAFLRCALALAVLVPLLVHEVRRKGRLARPLQGYAVVAGIFLGVDYVMWTMSILDVGAAVATVLINVQVIAFPLLARIIDGTAISRRFLFTIPVMLAGIALSSGALEHGEGDGNPVRGAVLGVAAGIAYAAYLYLNRVSGERSPAHVVTPICISTGAAAVAAGVISLFTTGISLSMSPMSWGWVIALALLGQVVAWLLISTGSPKLAPNTSAALLLLQPVMAIGFGLIILRETPTAGQLVGCVVVIAAVWFSNRRPSPSSTSGS